MDVIKNDWLNTQLACNYVGIIKRWYTIKDKYDLFNIETKIIFFIKNFIHHKVKGNNLLALNKLWLFSGKENFDVIYLKTYFKQYS